MKLLIVDDHPMMRDGMAALVGQASPDVVVLQASDALAGLQIAAHMADLDAVVLDLTLPGMNGFAALAEFQRSRPKLPVVVLSSSEDVDHVRRALALGARGYIPKSLAPNAVVAAVQLVLAGEVYLPPMMVNASATPAATARLTDRQADVLVLMSEGKANKEIGMALGLSEKTVKAHVGAIFRALGVVNRTQAVHRARKAKLLPE